MSKFFAKYLNWENLKDDFIQIYCDAYTEQELKEIYAFYQTPAGRKMVAKTPELTVKGMTITAAKVQANQAELQRMIQEAAAGGVDQ